MSQPLPDGVYIVNHHGMYQPDYGLAQLNQTQFVIHHPDEAGAGSTTWDVKFDSSQEAYTLQNPSSGRYLGYNSEAGPNMALQSTDSPGYWTLTPAQGEQAGTNTHIVTVKGREVYLSQSPLMIFPPLAALQPADSPFTGETKTAWDFIPAESS